MTLYLQSLNASLGGLFLRTATPLPAGTRARVSLKIEEIEMVADAEVVWTSAPGSPVPGMGLRLLAIHTGADAYAALLSKTSGAAS